MSQLECGGQRTTFRSRLSPWTCGSWESNSDLQAWLQGLFPTESLLTHKGMHENKEAFEDMTLECNKNIIEGEDYIAVTVLKSF